MTRLLVRLTLFALLSLAACAPTAPVPTESVPSAVQVTIASEGFTPRTPRVPFVLFDGQRPIANAQAVEVAAIDLTQQGALEPSWTGRATAYSDYDVPYWVVYPELPRAGIWGLGAAITLADGTKTQAEFVIQVAETVPFPRLGQMPPASQNRTLGTTPDLAKLTSDPEPEPDLYRLTVAEALESDKPTVVVFATPSFCRSRLCAPVVNSVKKVHRQLGKHANFIHIEVYKEFNPLVFADEMTEWHLESEPWVFVINAEGQVAAALGGPVSARELTETLTPLLKP